MDEAKIIVHGLTKFDTLDLGIRPGIEYREAEIDKNAQGEVVLFTAIVTMALISTFAAYLLRKHNGQSFEIEIEVDHPDGRKEKKRFRWNKESSEPPSAELIRIIRGSAY
jgi:Tfp pilus assembly pilus retraction ATPase PilT